MFLYLYHTYFKWDFLQLGRENWVLICHDHNRFVSLPPHSLLSDLCKFLRVPWLITPDQSIIMSVLVFPGTYTLPHSHYVSVLLTFHFLLFLYAWTIEEYLYAHIIFTTALSWPWLHTVFYLLFEHIIWWILKNPLSCFGCIFKTVPVKIFTPLILRAKYWYQGVSQWVSQFFYILDTLSASTWSNWYVSCGFLLYLSL